MLYNKEIVKSYKAHFTASPAHLVRAPGRVNLIGEHTDYNNGFVMPMAIDRYIWMAFSPRADQRVRIRSIDLEAEAEFSLKGIQNTNAGWIEYIKGVAWSLQKEGFNLRGWEGVITSSIPVGAGLSSSAALEMGTAKAFATVSGLSWDPHRMACLCKRAENEWVGVSCGIMDQLVVGVGKSNHAALIDCRSLDIQHVPVPPKTLIVIMDTMTRRELKGSVYNERRQQCQKAADFFGVPSLRDVSPDGFYKLEEQMDPTIRKRARHVITENQRTKQAAKAMLQKDPVRLGVLMNQSHKSLKEDFEVTNRALDLMTEVAQNQVGCYGARMTGAGFGGCAIALLEEGREEGFSEAVEEKYLEKTGIKPEFCVSKASDGVKDLCTD